MSDNTPIEWARHPVTGKGATWNPITGCRLVSEGCRHCYAARLAATRMKNHPSRKGLARANAAGEFKFTGEVRFNAEWLDQPLRWRAPRGIFVCAHGDLFAEGVTDEMIDKVFAVMALCGSMPSRSLRSSPLGHVFFVLTKRPERARAYISDPAKIRRVYELVCDIAVEGEENVVLVPPGLDPDLAPRGRRVPLDRWPLPNVWLGTSIEDQATADKRVPELLATPAAIRFVSAEPLLGEVDFTAICTGHYFIDALRGLKYHDAPEGVHSATEACARLDWIITGGESGPHARPMHPAWARSLRDQCAAARGEERASATGTNEGVPFLFKQWGQMRPVCERRLPELAAEKITVKQIDGQHYAIVGKSRSGRLLDGIEHNSMPEIA